jgi:hypothetical protein
MSFGLLDVVHVAPPEVDVHDLDQAFLKQSLHVDVIPRPYLQQRKTTKLLQILTMMNVASLFKQPNQAT